MVLILLPLLVLAHEIYLDRTRLPDLERFLRFELPATGEVRDAQGELLTELAREYRKRVTYDEVPPIVRQAVLAAEDKNFLSHSGIDYTALPRIVRKAALSTLDRWWQSEHGFRLMLPQGGSTITQQLVRGFFLSDLTRCERGDVLCSDGLTARVLATVVGVPAANGLLRKTEEARLTLWLEEEMRKRFGSREAAKREIFARYASFVYLGHGRYGFAAASEYYFDKQLSAFTPGDAGQAASLAGILKSPRDYAPVEGEMRPLRRRNEVLALMARNGFILESLADRVRAQPITVAARSPVKTRAPAVIGHVLAELKQRFGGRFAVEELFQGRIAVAATVDARVQAVASDALENGLALYEKRHPAAQGRIEGSVVVLRNADAAILDEVGGREVHEGRPARYSDYNRVTDSLRQPGSAWKPLVYLAAFRGGMDLETIVPDDRFGLPLGKDRGVKWISNYDERFQGPIPLRQALAESSNAATVWVACRVGLGEVARTARELGIRTPLQPNASTALGASEVRLLELAGAYRAMASGIAAEPHIIARVTDVFDGMVLYEAPLPFGEIRSAGLGLIQEGLRGVVRLPGGTARTLDGRDFPITVMAKTGTTNRFRDALFAGSTYGPQGITVAVRIGFDDNTPLGEKETGSRAALPIFREIMIRVYQGGWVGLAPEFPRQIEDGIDRYLGRRTLELSSEAPPQWAEGDAVSVAPPAPSGTVLQCSS